MFMQLESGLREDLLLCDHGELEPGRGGGEQREKAMLGAHSESLGRHLDCTLIGP